MLFVTESNIYNDKGYITSGILIKYHYGFNDHVVAIAVQYQNGQRNGFSKTFDTNGNLIRECFYKNGRLLNTTLYSPKEPEPEPVEYVCEKRPRKKFLPLDD